MIVAQMALHSELIHRSAIVHANFRLLRIVPHTHPDVVVASLTPDVVWHLKSDDQDPHVEFPGSLSEGMSPHKFVQPPDFGIIVRGVV